MKEDRIRIFRPYFGEEEMQALRATLESGWVGSGPGTAEFEQRFAAYLGVEHVVALNSASAALHLAMLAAQVEGQDVLTTAMTFVSTNHAILLGGGRPVFCDVEPDTLNISVREIERKITPTTRAIVVVHYGGHACDMDPIMALAREHGLWVVEDAAHACGGRYRERMLGTIGDMGCFSFQATKNMTTGDGGVLATNDRRLAERVRKLRWMGISRPTWERFRPGRPRRSWMYDVEELGFKYEMNDVAAALGLVQLARVEQANVERRCLVERYRQAFSATNGVEFLANRDYALSSCYLAVLKVDIGARDELCEYLDQHGIDSNVHYYPNHLLPLYRPYTTRLPVTEHESQRILSIPLYPGLRPEQQERVIHCVTRFAAGQRGTGEQRRAAQV
ncbi:MAG: DegT/DnrJ/EryC1/StrS family aminotransferase [Candidatus Latescibacterota bacterium]